MMLSYIYDGSFEGLLTAIYEAYYRRENPHEIISRTDSQSSLLDIAVRIDTDLEKADKVYNSIESKISPEALENVFYTFLSEAYEAGTWIYHYLKLGWKMGKYVDLYLSDSRVHNIHNLQRKVMREMHRMLGLIRFKLIKDNVYYALIEPDYNIVALVAPHFAIRLADQNWMIHDMKRGLAAVYNMKEWFLTDLDMQQDQLLCEKENIYRNLWKLYFKNIAINNRINPALQKSFMPVRYWKNLVEKQS